MPRVFFPCAFTVDHYQLQGTFWPCGFFYLIRVVFYKVVLLQKIMDSASRAMDSAWCSKFRLHLELSLQTLIYVLCVSLCLCPSLVCVTHSNTSLFLLSFVFSPSSWKVFSRRDSFLYQELISRHSVGIFHILEDVSSHIWSLMRWLGTVSPDSEGLSRKEWSGVGGSETKFDFLKLCENFILKCKSTSAICIGMFCEWLKR